MRTTFITQRWVSGDPVRDAELKECELRNRQTFGTEYVALMLPDFARVTFGELFMRCDAGLNIIANSDIYITTCTRAILEAWYAKGSREKAAMALSRWDDMPDGPRHHAHRDSQDTWVLHGRPPRALISAAAEVPMGVPGCDNRLAMLLQEHGYTVTNPSRTVRTYHVHASGFRTYGTGRGGAKNDRVPGPYLLVPPTELAA